MFKVYADESEQSDAGLFTIAGYALNSRDDSKFRGKWIETLRRWGVSELHMRELAMSRRDYKDWTERQKTKFPSDLAKIIHLRTKLHVIVVIDTVALSTVTEYAKAELKDARKYAIASTRFLADATAVLGKSGPIEFIFDQVPSKFGRDRLELEFYDQRRKGNFHQGSTIAWVDSKQYGGVQAADFLAYESGREYSRRLGRIDYSYRSSGHELISGMGIHRHNEALLGTEYMESLLDAIRQDPEGLATKEMLERWNRRERRRTDQTQ